MMAAGLNPMLAYSQGGASTPTGGVGNPMINAKAPLSQAVSNTASAAADLQNKHASNELLRAQASSTAKEAELKQIEINKAERTYGDGLKNWERTADTVLWTKEAEFAEKRWGESKVKEAISLIKEEIKNAAHQGLRIKADTGNIVADTIIKNSQGAIAQMEAAYVKTMGPSRWLLRDVGSGISSAVGLKSLRR